MTKNGIFWEFNLYDKVSSKILRINANIKGMSGMVKKAGAYLEEMGSSYVRFNAISDAVGRMRDTMASAIQPGVNFQQSMADLSAITGIAGDDLDNLGKAARKAGVKSGLGAAQAAEAFKLLASQISVDKIGIEGLKVLQKETITLAQASGLGMADAANALAGTINQFGYSAHEANRVINVLAAGAKYGAAEIPELAGSFKVVGATAAASGLSVEKTGGALEVLSKASIKGAEAGTQLRNILLSMQTKLGVDLKVTDLSDALGALAPKLEDTAFLEKTFGRESITAVQFLIKNADAVGEMTRKVSGSNVAMEQAQIRTATYAERMKRLQAWFDNVKISVFNLTGSFMPMLEIGAGALQQFSLMVPALRMIRDAYKLMRLESTKQLIIEKARFVWTKMQIAWNYILAASIRIVNLVTSMNPIILIATVVIGAIALIIKYWDDLKMYFIKLVKFWAKYLNPFGWLIQLVNYFFPEAGKKIKEFFSKIGDWIFGWIDKIVKAVKQAIGWISSVLGLDSDEKEINVEKNIQENTSTSISPTKPTETPEPTASDVAGDTFSGITSGGKKQTNVSVVVDKMVETFNVNSGAGESIEDIEERLIQSLLRVLNSSNRMQQA